MAEPAPPHAPRWPALAGAALCIALALLDAAWGPERIISATVVIAPFLTAVRGTTRQTAVVGALALACCVLSGVWNDNFGTVDYLLRVAVVAAGASFAGLAARTRIRLDASRARVRLIASDVCLANPQSVTCGCWCSSSRMFEGFTSRWTRPWA